MKPEIFKEQRQYFTDLFVSPVSPGHGMRVDPPNKQDVRVFSRGSLDDRVQMSKRMFDFECECLEKIGDDRVPTLRASSGTEVFAAAFGSPVHRPEDSMPFALPAVGDAEGADRLREPDLFSGPIGDIFTIADRLVALCGDYPVRICDVQSPFDIAALIWEKKSFFVALVDAPDAVHRLLRKVTDTLTRFIKAFHARYKDACLVHYPSLWMPPEFGMCCSEDDIGSISPRCFEEFCLPYLQELAREFGGISLHSCAAGQHQWDNFLKLPGIRYMNLHHPPTDLEVAIAKFSGRAVLAPGGSNGRASHLDFVKECLSLAKPETRFFFLVPAKSIEEARVLADQIKALCGRS